MSEPERSTDVRNEYNAISGTYDRRYEINPLNGVEVALRRLIEEVGARRVLEVGCGTGHWLKAFAPLVDRIIGLDSSSGMLQQARGEEAVFGAELQLKMVMGRVHGSL